MENRQCNHHGGTTALGNEAENRQGFEQAPAISLPKSGGAIRGMGKKTAAILVGCTSSLTILIATSPGRSGFCSQLSLSFDSGAGNVLFGLGWKLALIAITCKTDKGLTRYQDTAELDEFNLSVPEDLVPILVVCGEESAREVLLPKEEDESNDSHVGKVAGFSLHAGVAADAPQRDTLERLCRYISRPALSEKWLAVTSRGNVRLVFLASTEVRIVS